MEKSQHSDIVFFRLLAGLSGLISLIGLSLLLAGDSLAQEQPSGFQGGERKFSNPFADSRAQPEPTPAPPAGGFAPGQIQRSNPGVSVSKPGQNTNNEISIPGSRPDPEDVPDPVFRGNTVEVGGESQIVEKEKLEALRVSPEAFGIDASIKVKDFNFPDADIIDVAKTLGKLTGKNFILDKKVNGKVSIISNSTITVGDAWKAFLTALDINQLTLLPSGKYIRIARQRDARDRQLKTYTDARSPDIDSLVTRIFSLKHIDSDEVARTFRSFVPPNARIIPYDQTNSVIVTDTGSNIKKLEKMLQFLDVPGFDAGIEVINVAHASAAELAKLVDSLIPGQPAPGTTAGRRRRGGSGGGSFTARKTKGGGIINNIIADERTNTLIVHANAVGAQQVRALVRKLDKKLPAMRGGGKIHVIYLKFADAEEISKTLNDLGQADQNTGRRRRTTSRGGSSTGINPVSSSASLFEGEIKVSADKATNSLVVTASPSDFVTVQRVVNQLDIDRDQVFVEALIMEMNLNNDFDYSVNVAKADRGIFLSPRGDIVSLLTQPAAQRGLILSLGDTNNTTEFNVGGTTVDIPNWLALVKAIQTNSKGDILATPQILTLDNVEATFEATEQIPVLSSAATTTTVSQSITRQPVGLTVKVKPQINKVSNFVKMEIDASLSDIVNRELPAAVQAQAFSTFDRKTTTTVVVADGDTVILGGLIRDNVSNTESKVPILGDIPLLGWLFKGKQKQSRKTNLLIFMTPHIIRHYEKARAILDKKLQERDEFLEKHAGGEDPYRDTRDKMIRGLPDIKELLRKDADTAFTIGDEETPDPAEPDDLTIDEGETAVLPEANPAPQDLNPPQSRAQSPLGNPAPPAAPIPTPFSSQEGAPEQPPIAEPLELAPPVDDFEGGTQFIDELEQTE